LIFNSLLICNLEFKNSYFPGLAALRRLTIFLNCLNLALFIKAIKIPKEWKIIIQRKLPIHHHLKNLHCHLPRHVFPI